LQSRLFKHGETSVAQAVVGSLFSDPTTAAVVGLLPPEDTAPELPNDPTGLFGSLGGFCPLRLAILGSVYSDTSTLLPLLSASHKSEERWNGLFTKARDVYNVRVRTGVLNTAVAVHARVLDPRFISRNPMVCLQDAWHLSTTFRKFHHAAQDFAVKHHEVANYGHAGTRILQFLFNTPYDDEHQAFVNIAHSVRNAVNDWSEVSLTPAELQSLEIKW
jgi:hypothetical protein